MFIRLLLAAAVSLALSALPALGLVHGDAEGYQTIVSPDGVPLAGLKHGRVKILSIALYPAHRDSLELADRMDCLIATIRTGASYYPDEFERRTVYWTELRVPEPRMTSDALAALSRNWDVIVLGANPSWGKYPEVVRQAIIDKVSGGARLLAIGLGDEALEDMKKTGLAFEELKLNLNRFGSISEVRGFQDRYYRFGKGRVATVNYQGDSRFGYLVSLSKTLLDDQYKYRRVASLIYKLGKGIDAGEIEEARMDSETSCLVSLAEADAPRAAAWRVVDVDCNKMAQGISEVRPGARSVQIKLPDLPNGPYCIELDLSRDGSIVDWISVMHAVDSNPAITSAKLTKDTLRTGDELNLDIGYSDAANRLSLTVDIDDVHGRRYFTRDYSSLPQNITMRVPEGSLSVLNYVRLSLRSGARLLDRKTVEFTIPEKAESKDFQIWLWSGAGDDVRSKKYHDVIYNSGVTGFANCGHDEVSARAFAASGLVGMPYTTVLAGTLLDDGMFSEEWVGGMRERAQIAARAFSKYGSPGYTLGDEIYLSAFDPKGRFSTSPKVVGLFRDWLRNHYTDISALNKQWDSSYTSFDAVTVQDEQQLLADEKNPSPWVDYRMFLTDSFMNLHYDFRDLIHTIHPGAKVGYDGCEQYSSYDGYDWFKYTRGLDINNVYAQYQIKGAYPNKMFNGQCVRSFTSKDNLRGGWMNGLDSTWGLTYTPWYMAFAGFNSVWWWTATFLGPECDAYDIDLKPSSIYAQILKTANEIQEGAGTILKHADLAPDPIAIHYSENNWHASTLSSGMGLHVNNLGLINDDWFKKPMCGSDPDELKLFGDIEPVGHYATATKNFLTLFSDLGFQPEMIARQEIEQGKLSGGQYSVMVLPFVESLGSQEIANIRDFVSNGGMLIADYRTGIRDEHCKFYDKSPLDDVFGIERSSYGVEKRDCRISVDDNFGPMNGELRGLFCHPDIKVTTGTATGHNEFGVPVFIVNQYGKGRTLFLNSDLYAYFNARRNGVEDDYKDIIRGFISFYGNVRPPYNVTSDRAPVPHTEVFAYTDGDIDYIGVIRDFFVRNHRDFDVSVPLKRSGHLYSVRDKAYLGYTDTAQTRMASGDASLLALLPYKVEGLQMGGDTRVKRGNAVTLKLRVRSGDGQNPGNHTVNVKVFDSENRLRSYLSRAVYLKAGEGAYDIPVALNDPRGKWCIEAVEAVSGKTVRHELSVD